MSQAIEVWQRSGRCGCCFVEVRQGSGGAIVPVRAEDLHGRLAQRARGDPIGLTKRRAQA